MGLKFIVMSYATCSGNAGAPRRGSGRKRRRCISVATISVTDICARGSASGHIAGVMHIEPVNLKGARVESGPKLSGCWARTCSGKALQRSRQVR